MRSWYWWLLRFYICQIFYSKRVRAEYKLFIYLNKARRSYGLSWLRFQKDLRKVARKHSVDMARNDYFAHEGLSGSTPQTRYLKDCVSDVVSGENLAKVRGFQNPVLISHDGLMNSPGHKANILSKSYNCVGIGLAISANKTYYFTQNFAYREILISGLKHKMWFGRFKKLKLEKFNLLEDHYFLELEHENQVVWQKEILFKGGLRLKIQLPLLNRGSYCLKIYNKKTRLLINEFQFKKGWWG